MRLGSKIASKRLLRQWPPIRLRLQILKQFVGSLVARVTSLAFNAASGSSSPDSARSWNCFNKVTAPQPLGPSGPMVQGHLMTIGMRDVDLVLAQALKTNMQGMPSYYGSHVNNTTLGLRIGSITCGKNQTVQSAINPSEFID